MVSLMMPGAVDVAVRTEGAVRSELRSYGRSKMEWVARLAPAHVLSAHLDLEMTSAPDRPAVAKGRLDVNGTPVRAHVAAPTMRAAIDILEARLRQRLAQLSDVRTSERRRIAGDGRRSYEADTRPEFTRRPPEHREVRRVKHYADDVMTPEAAVQRAELLDYDFFVFVNADTRHDAFVRRDPAGAWELIDTGGHDRDSAVPNAGATPARCSVRDAEQLLDVSGARFVFFVEPHSRRAHALYRRFDGHYGLLAPPR